MGRRRIAIDHVPMSSVVKNCVASFHRLMCGGLLSCESPAGAWYLKTYHCNIHVSLCMMWYKSTRPAFCSKYVDERQCPILEGRLKDLCLSADVHTVTQFPRLKDAIGVSATSLVDSSISKIYFLIPALLSFPCSSRLQSTMCQCLLKNQNLLHT
jgi:hypothetical protein